MRSTRLCAILCVVATGTACAVDFCLGRVPAAQSQILPVHTFPLQIAKWHGGPEIPVDPQTYASIPTAIISDRLYEDPEGHLIDLTLVTAATGNDLHDQSICLPDQGWKTLDSGTTRLGSQLVNILHSEHAGQNITCLYWRTGTYSPQLSQHQWLREAEKLREHFYHTSLDCSLEVRILSNSDYNSPVTLSTFTNPLIPAVNRFVAAHGTS
jgi:hypothetical protein